VDSIVIRWPSGKAETLGPQSADQELVIEEGRGITARRSASTAQPGKSGKAVRSGKAQHN
jgi:hypothetical protein